MATVPDSRPRALSVTELTRRIRTLIEGEFRAVCVEGELSNVRRPASGHCYFTLKDEAAQIRGVIWRSGMAAMPVLPRDGLKVRVWGDLTVYERDGSYQIAVRRLEEAGKGSLQAQFEALKKALGAEGLLDAARKRPLPMLPQHIGIVTSPTGAAIRDILTVLGRRFPNLHVVLAPARVQGEGAAAEVAAALDLLNARGGLDVIIVGRGGGSLEDLWCFNEEPVARAVARSAVPVISAVGHETDFTICDFVADLRAPTPSAAAELVVGRKEEFVEALTQARRALARALRQAWLEARQRFTAAAGSYVFREPGAAAKVYRQRVERLAMQSRLLLERGLRDTQQRVDDLGVRLQHSVQLRAATRAERLRSLGRQLAAYNPQGVLNRGYSIARRADGRILRSHGDVTPGERIVTRLACGSITSEVKETYDPEEDGHR